MTEQTQYTCAHIALLIERRTRKMNILVRLIKKYLLKNFSTIDTSLSVYDTNTGGRQRFLNAVKEHKHTIIISASTQQTKWLDSMVYNRIPTEIPIIVCSEREPQHLENVILFVPFPNKNEYACAFARILNFLPSIRHILIFQGEIDAKLPRNQELIAHLKTKNYIVDVQPLPREIRRTDIMSIRSSDICIVLDKTTPLSYINRLSIIASQHKTVLYHSAEKAMLHGAAITFGLDTQALALMITRALYAELMCDKVQIQTNAVYRLKANYDTLQNQGVSLPRFDPFLSLIGDGYLVEPTSDEKVAAFVRQKKIPLE